MRLSKASVTTAVFATRKIECATKHLLSDRVRLKKLWLVMPYSASICLPASSCFTSFLMVRALSVTAVFARPCITH